MKADVFKSEVFVHQAGNNMLTGMILHPAKTLLGIQPAGNVLPDRGQFVQIVQDHAVLFMHIQYTGIPDPAGIGRLSAAFREKSRSVQDNSAAAVLQGYALQHIRREREEMTVNVIKFLSVKLSLHKSPEHGGYPASPGWHRLFWGRFSFRGL